MPRHGSPPRTLSGAFTSIGLEARGNRRVAAHDLHSVFNLPHQRLRCCTGGMRVARLRVRRTTMENSERPYSSRRVRSSSARCRSPRPGPRAGPVEGHVDDHLRHRRAHPQGDYPVKPGLSSVTSRSDASKRWASASPGSRSGTGSSSARLHPAGNAGRAFLATVRSAVMAAIRSKRSAGGASAIPSTALRRSTSWFRTPRRIWRRSRPPSRIRT